MKIYIYDPEHKETLHSLSDDEAHSLANNSSSLVAQETLARLHSTRKWVACSCNEPMALMYPRNGVKNYALVNHYHSGLHSSGCVFYTSVKGTERETNHECLDQFNEDLVRENSFSLFRDFKDKGEKVKPQETTQSKVSSTEPKLDTLLRILHNCIDKAFANYFLGNSIEGSKLNDVITFKLKTLKDSSASMFIKGSNRTLSTSLFTGIEGYGLAESQLLYERSKGEVNRPSAVVIMVANKVDYNSRTKRLTLIYQETESKPQIVHLDGLNRPPILASDISMPFNYPSIVIAALSFEKPESELPSALKVAVQPIAGEGSLCPVDNHYEASFLCIANKVIKQTKLPENERLYVSKSLFGLKGNPAVKPNLTLSYKVKNEERYNMFIELVLFKGDQHHTKAQDSLDHIKNFLPGDSAIFKAYEYTEPEQFVFAVIDFVKVAISKLLSNKAICNQ